ncbi:MAG TPA: AI-2E family transporter [Anaerolineales bacterium]
MVKAAWVAAVVTATLVVLVILWRFAGIVVLFLLSLAIAAALRPIIRAASRGKISRQGGLTIVYALLILFIVGGFLLLIPPLVRDIQQAVNDLMTGYEFARTNWPQNGGIFLSMLAGQMPPSENLYSSLTSPEGITTIQAIFGAAGGFLSLFGYSIIAIMLSLYWSADQFRFERLALSLLPKEQHEAALHAWRAVETGVGAFIRREFLQVVLSLVILGAGYWALGMKYPVLLAVWAALAGLIPWFGVAITLLPAVLIWFGVAPYAGFIFAIFTLSALILIRRIIQPRLFETPPHNSLMTLLLILAMGQGFGLLGVLLAPILALALRLLFNDLNPAPRGRFAPEVVRKATDLKDRLARLRQRDQNGTSSETLLLLDRIHALARNTRDYLRGY